MGPPVRAVVARYLSMDNASTYSPIIPPSRLFVSSSEMTKTSSQNEWPVHAAPLRKPLYVAAPPLREDGRPIIQRVMIANRGEIACRIIQTCRKLNISSIAIFVDEYSLPSLLSPMLLGLNVTKTNCMFRDSSSLHIRHADESINIGSINHSKHNPFLDIDLLIRTALSVQADAIHPGYGYLSENAEFAQAVRQAGMIFIGPGHQAMSTLGDKRAAKDYLRKHAPDVPLIPGYAGSSQDAKELGKVAAEIGFPVMLKASAGGGGKGMRIIRKPDELQAELERAQSEAQRSFGSADCILEKYVESSKHVEIQIVGDSHGEVISFFERDCSVQRRHQKVIEETPCSFLNPETRQMMSAAALRIARLIGYENAGTVEFVLDIATGKFYFLEVNARLQVEHPITEEVTGVDLVSLQLFVAAGGSLRSLPVLQNITQYGHAIECRLCAEDPRRNFFPENGKIHLWLPAPGPLGPSRDVRYEAAINTGASVSIYFDSMIAKIVVWAPTRALAIEKMVKVLAHTVCVGVKTNQLLLQHSLLHRAFRNPAYTTSFLPGNLDELLREPLCLSNPELRHSFSIIPATVLRNLATSAPSQSRPFQHIRRQFRNQRYDLVNLQYDIITLLDWPYNVPQDSDTARPLICVWKPQSLASQSLSEAYLLAMPDSEDFKGSIESVTGSMSACYNQISQAFRERQMILSGTRYTVSVDSWQPVEANTTGPESCIRTTLEISINGSKILAHVVVNCAKEEALAGCLNREQSVFCHLPVIGTYLEFRRDTALTFIESKRAREKPENGETKTVTAPMPCKVLSVLKKNGDEVKSGDSVMVIESMKMEVTITVSADGKFQTSWKQGDAVGEGKILCNVI
ncbi:hypothetical protein ARAM_002008 [Aspergillus rambellii]|uniref:Uncharacterized protein n=2 Tax=Aspergillus subgen. Nidulantes TaxID=2720870 RepID=A0A0F8WBJ2_9EURO|nr:hypothetical protein ARAM_002008 [Aspergillus rambellii]